MFSLIASRPPWHVLFRGHFSLLHFDPGYRVASETMSFMDEFTYSLTLPTC